MKFDPGTLALQAVNVLILIWLLQRFFWRPVAAIIAQRRAAADAMLNEAAARAAEAAAAQADIAQVRQGFADERAALLAAAETQAEAMRRRTAAEAAEAARKLEAATRERLAAEEAAARNALHQEAATLAVEIAARLVARLDGPALRAAFLDGAIAEIARLPAAARQTPGTLTLATATELGAQEQATYAGRLQDAFGAALPVDFITDPDLLAGLELRAGNLQLSNHWRADLARIREGLRHEP